MYLGSIRTGFGIPLLILPRKMLEHQHGVTGYPQMFQLEILGQGYPS